MDTRLTTCGFHELLRCGSASGGGSQPATPALMRGILVEHDLRASAPLVTLFERDDAIAVPLLSQLRLAGYDVRAARTPVELFDLLTKNLVSLVLVDLGAATAGRREFWVALDAHRRDRALQVVTFRFVSPIGDLDFEFEPSARAIADVEAHGAHEFGRIIEVVRQRVPLHGPEAGSGASYAPDGAIQPIGAALGLPPNPYNQHAEGVFGAAASVSMQHFQGGTYGVAPLGIAPTGMPAAGFGTGSPTLAASGYAGPSPAQGYHGATPMGPGGPFAPAAGGHMEVNGFPAQAPNAQYGAYPAQYQGGHAGPYAGGYPAEYQGGYSGGYPGARPAAYPGGSGGFPGGLGQASASSSAPSLPGGSVSPFAQPAASNPFGSSSDHSPFAQPYERNPFGQGAPGPSSPTPAPHSFSSTPSQSASLWPSAPQSGGAMPFAGPGGPHPGWGGSGGYITVRSEMIPGQWSAPEHAYPNPFSPLAQSDALPHVAPSSPSPLPTPSMSAFQDAWYPPDEAETPTGIAPEIQFQRPIPAPYTPPTLGAIPATYENPFLSDPRPDPRRAAGANPPPVSQSSQLSQLSQPSGAASPARFGAQERPWDSPRQSGAPAHSDPFDQSTVRLEPNTIPALLAAAAQAAQAAQAPSASAVASAASGAEPAPFVSATPTEQALGKVLVEGELLSAGKLETLRNIQGMLANANMPRRLGELAVMFKFLSADQLLAAALVSRGLVSPQQISALGRVKQELAAQGIERDLRSLLLQNNVLHADQLHQIQMELAS